MNICQIQSWIIMLSLYHRVFRQHALNWMGNFHRKCADDADSFQLYSWCMLCHLSARHVISTETSVKVDANNVLVAVLGRASWQIHKITGCASAGNAGNVFPDTCWLAIPARPWLSCEISVTYVPWCIAGYYNMIVVFFSGFDRFIPGFDRFIPGFDRFIPASIPVTGTLPPTIQMHKLVQISRTEYITKYYRNMVDQIPQKRILRPQINGNPIVYIGDLTFEIGACTSGASRHHGAHEGTPAWTKLNLNQVGDPIKRNTDLFKYGYIPYV